MFHKYQQIVYVKSKQYTVHRITVRIATITFIFTNFVRLI